MLTVNMFDDFANILCPSSIIEAIGLPYQYMGDSSIKAQENEMRKILRSDTFGSSSNTPVEKQNGYAC